MSRYLTLLFFALMVPSLHAEPQLPESASNSSGYVEAGQVNRWKGGFPEESGSGINPWSNSSSLGNENVPERNEGQAFSGVPEKFPDPAYSPYDEGRKKIRTRARHGYGHAESQTSAMPPQTNQPPVNIYVMPGGASPYGSGYGYPPYGGRYPEPYGQPWGGYYGAAPPWGGAPYPGGGYMPFNGAAPWAGDEFGRPWADYGVPWGGGDNGFFPFW